MDTLQQTQASRRGGRSFITKFLAKAQAITDAYTETTDTVCAEDKDAVDLILSQLSQKKQQLEELDSTIASAITTENDLEEEIDDAEVYHFTLTERLANLLKISCSPIPAKDQTLPLINTQPNVQSIELGSVEHTASGPVSNSLLHTHVPEGRQSVGQFVIRLPKLTLPKFGGDLFQF